MKKRNNNRSMKKVLLTQLILLACTILLITFSLQVFETALSLFVISDNIHFIEENGRWTESAHQTYDENIAARLAIKNESIIGYVLVVMGSSMLTQALRLIILIGLFILDCFAIYICYSFIKADILYVYKKLQEKFQKSKNRH